MAAITDELKVTEESPELTAAIRNVGRATLIDRDRASFVDAVNTYCPPLVGSTSDRLRQMTFRLATITGSVCRRLEISFGWK